MAPVAVLPNDEHNARLVRNVHPAGWQNPTPTGRYNLVVIGGGSAGLVAAVGAAGLGAKVALIERHLLGGDCLNVGCVPSKSVIRSAKVLGEVRRAGTFGVQVADPTVDFGAVMARMRQVRAAISDHDAAERFRNLGIDLYLGEGTFSGPDQVTVGEATLLFRKALIATGSRPAVPAVPGLAEAGCLTNESVFSLVELPRRLAVIGGGPIGCELAQAFRRFGSGVTLFQSQSRLLPREDEDVSALIAATFQAEGLDLKLSAQVSSVEQTADGKEIIFQQGTQTQTVVVDEILVATGRAPNVEGLGLERAGVAYNERGIQVQETLQSTNPAIYAAGDVGFRYQFTHAADATARIVLQNALFPGPKKKASALVIPWCTYTAPEIAHVGLSAAEAVQQNVAVETFTQSIGEVDRGRTDGEPEGFVRVRVRKGSDQIVGATIVASHAGEMINELTLAMVTKVGLKTLATVIHPYPTQAEAIKKVADAYNRTRLTPTVKWLFRRLLAWQR
jgi:pyruvate/2-oxoglutarate dehydrogenase complex dihydrolipoamide dehydrogenase (E3) component